VEDPFEPPLEDGVDVEGDAGAEVDDDAELVAGVVLDVDSGFFALL
jgi:hypothetical protein